MTITEPVAEAIGKVPADAWTPAYDGGGQVRDGAWVADITGLLDLDSWPGGMRVIVRKERPHPGAQLRFTDIDGHRFTAFATDARKGQLAVLELRHRQRARCEDRIRCAKDTGLRNLPLKGFAQNQLWCEIVALACELLAWTQMLALTGDARRWEPKRLRLRLFSVAGRIVRGEPPPAPASRAELALGRGESPPRSPGCRPSRPADQPKQPLRQERRAPGPVEPRPPGATAGQPGTTERWNPAPGRCHSPPPHERERSRLIPPIQQNLRVLDADDHIIGRGSLVAAVARDPPMRYQPRYLVHRRLRAGSGIRGGYCERGSDVSARRHPCL